jgi:hypothetical protein
VSNDGGGDGGDDDDDDDDDDDNDDDDVLPAVWAMRLTDGLTEMTKLFRKQPRKNIEMKHFNRNFATSLYSANCKRNIQINIYLYLY